MLLDELNEQQRVAAAQCEGAVMIVAGAGSGKTRTLTYRVAHLLECGASPYSILVLTFTNKAAKEMKERIVSLIGDKAKAILMGTFHSVFARILRLEAEKLGYVKNFVIYDTSDSKSLLKSVVKDMGLNNKVYNLSYLADRISKAKSSLVSASEYMEDVSFRSKDAVAGRPATAEIFVEYEKRLRKNMAMDFDDLLFNMYKLLLMAPDVAEKYKQRFRYIMVDEYQDTNHAQYAIVKALASRHGNICVVGDDAQSIYAFRGANIQNILKFKKDYDNVHLFKLERNYRSTGNIVNAANSVIEKNIDQIKKTVWTDNLEGSKIEFRSLESDKAEAEFVCNRIKQKMAEGCAYSDFAILYRTNSQSRALEDALRLKNIPYRLYGGTSFYSRKEIKDVLAYMRLVVNNKDDEAFVRIVNYPARGIGQTSMDRLHLAAGALDCSLFEAVYADNLSEHGLTSSAVAKLRDFCSMIGAFSSLLYTDNAFELGKKIILRSRIIETLKDEDIVENIEELLAALQSFTEAEEENIIDELTGEEISVENKTLDVFLQRISLLTDSDKEEDDTNCVSLMTIHSSKGLEFEDVFIVGMEENLFPSTLSLASRTDTEEERRLFYVALTRAKQSVTLSCATMRYKYGQIIFSEKSRFIDDIAKEYLDCPNGKRQLPAFGEEKPKKVLPLFESKRKPITSLKSNLYTKKAERREENASEFTEPAKCIVGEEVYHNKFGRGTIISMEGKGADSKAVVDFVDNGEKTLILKFAKLKKYTK